uniref:Uncharacterized protein n=1 Tax=Melanopsichium pennsylvanicum 4 TaxID=1398559 RepID=A0A077R9G8_9BASI|nr:uncharacterized protein BN887_01849 [Melanopsichium pennsylvanicum 4]
MSRRPMPSFVDLAHRTAVTGLVGLGFQLKSPCLIVLWTHRWPLRIVMLTLSLLPDTYRVWDYDNQIWGLWLTAAVWKSRRDERLVSPALRSRFFEDIRAIARF